MARKRNVKTRDTRGAILQAAYKLFLENGFHGTSMRQIASKAGLTVAAAYNHFKNKEQLYISVLRTRQPYVRILPALEQAEGDTIEEFLSTAARRMIEVLEREPGFLKLMFIEIVEFKNKHFPELIDDVFPRLIAFIQKIPLHKGCLRRIPPPLLVRSFLGLFFSYYITELLIWKYLPPSMRTDRLEDFVDVYLHGVIEPSPAVPE
jgi:AcrR family transcriptional regulator